MRSSFEARFVALFASLLIVAACSGKSESNPRKAPPAPVAGATTSQAGSSSGSPSGGNGGNGGNGGLGLAGVEAVGAAGSAGDAVGGAWADPCGGDPGPMAGTGVIGGTYGNGGNGGSAGAPQTVYLDCSAYERCGVSDPSCPVGTSCIKVPGCETPICGGDLCAACPGDCGYLLIVPPTQVWCPVAEYVGIEPRVMPIPCN